MNASEELRQVAARVVWFETPEKTLENQTLFLCHLMIYGTLEDVLVAKKFFPDAAFEEALQASPSGIFDARSWAYWNVALGNIPVPPMKQRFV